MILACPSFLFERPPLLFQVETINQNTNYKNFIFLFLFSSCDHQLEQSFLLLLLLLSVVVEVVVYILHMHTFFFSQPTGAQKTQIAVGETRPHISHNFASIEIHSFFS